MLKAKLCTLKTREVLSQIITWTHSVGIADDDEFPCEDESLWGILCVDVVASLEVGRTNGRVEFFGNEKHVK